MIVTLQRSNQSVRFTGANAAGNTVTIEGSPDIGGEGLGARPMELLLMSLASCSSMDLVTILKKMRQPLDDLKVTVDGERATEEKPPVFKKIHLHFDLWGALREENVVKALRLSVDEYCSVARMLAKTAVITWDFSIHPKP